MSGVFKVLSAPRVLLPLSVALALVLVWLLARPDGPAPSAPSAGPIVLDAPVAQRSGPR